jgi:hypothetical protein
MARKKSEWTPWKRLARKQWADDYAGFIQGLKKQYPASVQKTILMAMSVAEIMTGSVESLPLCSYYADDCELCVAYSKVKFKGCAFPAAGEADLRAAKKLYATLYRKMPDKWKKIL